MRNLTNPSREGRRFIAEVLRVYVKDMINDYDYQRVEREILDIVRAERGLVVRVLKRPSAARPRAQGATT